MTPWVTRIHAITAAGHGVEALVEAVAAGRPLLRPAPYAVEGLRSPFGAFAGAGQAKELLDSVVNAVLPAEGDCGLVVGTTSGAISGPFERWHRGGGGEEQAWRQEPARWVASRRGLKPVTTVSVACASGAAAFDIARGWLRSGRCARVIVAGVDALSLYIHAGFAGLGALSAGPSRPFTPGRDGLMLGEGAAALLLETPEAARGAGRTAMAALRGIGLSQDGMHLTAPDPDGAGLVRAMRAALADGRARPEDVGCLSAHATGTPFNDAMEEKAYAAVFGTTPPAHGIKSIVGHTLGAAGTVEAALLVAVLAGAHRPPSLPGHPPATTGMGLSVNAAFGGVNVALLFGPPQEGPFPSLGAREAESVRVEGDDFPLATLWPGAPPALGRADNYVRAGIAALRGLQGALTPETAVVLSSESNCRAADLRYHAGLIAQGPARASRVHFPYTIPGAPLAEAAIPTGLRGPALVLLDGAEAGRTEARRLVAWGQAPAAVALHIECPERSALAEAVRYVPAAP